MTKKYLASLVILTLLLAVLLTACAKSPAVDEPPVEEDKVSVGLFVVEAFGDRAFYDIGLEGLKLIESRYDVNTNQYEGQNIPENFPPLLNDAARNNDLVVVLGFEAIDAMLEMAPKHPDTIFIFLDATLGSEDVVSLGYKDEEGCYLAGALAAATTSHSEIKRINAEKVIGFVGGVDDPVIRRCLAGYTQGAAYVDPGVTVEAGWVGSWGDPAKGKEVNLALMDAGADINFQYAGLSGEGGFNAAKETDNFYVIGSGFDQRWLAPDQTIGSLLKRVDLSMVYLTGLYLDGDLKKGDEFTWGVAEDGLPMAVSDDIVPAEIVEQLHEIEEKVKAGEIEVKPDVE